MQPLLPSLLAACAPQAELILTVKPTQGKPDAPMAYPFRALQRWLLCNRTPFQMCTCPI